MDYIELHFKEDITGAKLEQQFGYSADYLSRLMRRHTGNGFKRYIVDRRIAEAKSILRSDPHIKVTAVAESVGFHSFSLFNRIFKRTTGMTAAAYRK